MDSSGGGAAAVEMERVPAQHGAFYAIEVPSSGGGAAGRRCKLDPRGLESATPVSTNCDC